ncbi:toxin RelE [Escherichia coli]|nr:addiction module toxin RelE [Escherichia coli]KHJ14526.1 toxin RelE [Escherichia coli]
MSAQFWNRASIKQKIPVTILYILLFSVVQCLCYIREVMTHKEYDFFTAVHRTKGKK